MTQTLRTVGVRGVENVLPDSVWTAAVGVLGVDTAPIDGNLEFISDDCDSLICHTAIAMTKVG